MPRNNVRWEGKRAGRVLIATRNTGKMRELQPMFADAGIALVSLEDARIPADALEDSLEVAATFEENALAKARYFHGVSGLATVADDSGLEVAVLSWAPGVRSKRWSGRPELSGQALDDANNALLLQRLKGCADRRSRYVCAAAYCDGAREFVERGEVAGVITLEARGSGGFGYDPFFQSEELGRTFGEVPAAEKARVSHRARAFGKLLQHIRSRG